MLDILNFIFRDFITWLGVIILLGVLLSGLAEVINAIRGGK